MSDRYYVICGNKREFDQYYYDKQVQNSFLISQYPDRRDWVYVSGIHSIRGCKIEHGVFYGSWRKISQLEDFFHILMCHCEPGSPALPKIKSVYDMWLKE